MNKIYLIPGLGADQRVFDTLKMAGETIPIQWILPYLEETLPEYCKRLIEANGIGQKSILIGVSFGGMIASEIVNHIQVQQLILISSVKNKYELPLLFRFAGKLKLDKWLPLNLLKLPNFILRYAFGPLSVKDYQLLRQIIEDTNIHFLKWAIRQILEWPAANSIPTIIHIHGTSDRIFPDRNIKKYIPITGGGHFMIVNRAEEISQIINKLLLNC